MFICKQISKYESTGLISCLCCYVGATITWRNNANKITRYLTCNTCTLCFSDAPRLVLISTVTDFLILWKVSLTQIMKENSKTEHLRLILALRTTSHNKSFTPCYSLAGVLLSEIRRLSPFSDFHYWVPAF